MAANALCVLQLAGIAVLAIGLWLRFDSQTKSIFEQENNHSSFYTGEREGLALQLWELHADLGPRDWGREAGHISQPCPFQVR
jgi:hypothetical protein